jgi:hypothetical protein
MSQESNVSNIHNTVSSNDPQLNKISRTVGVARSLSAMTSGSPGAHENRSPDSQQWPTTTYFPVTSLAFSLSTTMGCWAPYLDGEELWRQETGEMERSRDSKQVSVEWRLPR